MTYYVSSGTLNPTHSLNKIAIQNYSGSYIISCLHWRPGPCHFATLECKFHKMVFWWKLFSRKYAILISLLWIFLVAAISNFLWDVYTRGTRCQRNSLEQLRWLPEMVAWDTNWGTQGGPGAKHRWRYGDKVSPRSSSSLQTLFTDFDCKDHQNVKLSHNSRPYSWPVWLTMGGG